MFFDSADLYNSYIIIVQLISALTFLASTTFHLDFVMIIYGSLSFLPNVFKLLFKFIRILQQMKHPDFSIILIYRIYNNEWTVFTIMNGNLFALCFCGKLATESYRIMPNYLYEPNGRKIPVDLQKYFVLMIGNAQMPLSYHGYHIAIVDLETYLNVRVFRTHFCRILTIEQLF